MNLFSYREKPGYFRRLKEALQATKKDLTDQVDQILGAAESRITAGQLEDLESLLITCDIGVETTLEIIEKIREDTRKRPFVTSSEVRRLLRAELLEILNRVQDKETVPQGSPHVILIVGVNGVGKTTTIGKLVHLFGSQGKSTLICASDTFRAAAIEQLEIWAERTGSEIVKQSHGADPAAVLFDALGAAKSRGKDIVIVDTAGRLHTKSNLMQELAKIRRVAERQVEGAPQETYLILDATTGQNGLVQAREFLSSIGITGIIVAKLDGTAKGGIVVAIARELKIPIRYIGVGEKQGDLIPFSAEAFVDSLLSS